MTNVNKKYEKMNRFSSLIGMTIHSIHSLANRYFQYFSECAILFQLLRIPIMLYRVKRENEKQICDKKHKNVFNYDFPLNKKSN